MKNIKILLGILLILISCNYKKPAFNFSNFYNTEAENVAEAIRNDNAKIIRDEVLKRKVNVNFKDDKYEVSLLALAIANKKKKAFEELLVLGADPNISNSYCVSPLLTAIIYNQNCDLFFIKGLLDYNAKISPRFFKKCNYTYNPIQETLISYNEKNKIKCGEKILKLLVEKLNNPNLLSEYNNEQDYQENIIYIALDNKNLNLLKYLLIDLNFQLPTKIFIDRTVLPDFKGYKSLKGILKSKEFEFDSDYMNDPKEEILSYLYNS